jgi:hypothetical protein
VSMSMSRCETLIDRIQMQVDDSHLLPAPADCYIYIPLSLPVHSAWRLIVWWWVWCVKFNRV